MCGRIFFVIKGRDVSGKIMRFIVRLKRIPRLFVVWHGKSSVEIILSELIIPFFRLFFKDEKCRQKHAEFISEFCVFLFALSIGRFRWILENILMRICRTRLPFLCALYIFFFAFARAGFRHLVAYIDKKFNRVVCGGGKHNRNPMQLIHVVLIYQKRNVLIAGKICTEMDMIFHLKLS